MANVAEDRFLTKYKREQVDLAERNLIDLEERFQGVRETALAVCHHFSQPLTVVMCLIDLLMMQKERSDEIDDILNNLKKQTEVMEDILKRLREVQYYNIKNYNGFKMLNLEDSTL